MRSIRAGRPRWIAGSMASLRPSPRSHARRSRSLHTRARSDWTWRKANPAMMTSEEIQIAPRRRKTSFTEDSSSGAELGEAQPVGEEQRHQLLGGERAQAAGGAGALGELGHGVGAAVGAPEQHRHRLPAVALEDGGGGVVAGDGEDVGL